MKYFANYMADAVVREDTNGNRFFKTIENLRERPAGKESTVAWGGERFGYFYSLEPISEEEYNTFGVSWDWSPMTGEKRTLFT